MNNTIIRIEGSIFSPDILDRLEDTPSQAPATYGLPAAVKVKDEIARAWAFAQDDWQKFQNRLNTLSPDSAATTETRNYWIIPLLERLDYRLEYRSKAEEINGKLYPISHRAVNRGNLPVHIVGYNDKNGLDRRPENASTRMSAHALLQEFLNLDEQLYGIVTNGKIIRLLRDSSRLVKLSYLEFDLDQILGDELYSEFALLYRLLHATRMPSSTDTAADSLIEKYHQDSLESGARIRSGLSNAVENAIVNFGNGFLKHPQNTELRRQVDSGGLTAQSYYQKLLRLIYRLLFLMVIEERDLVYPEGTATVQRELYRKYYSIYRLRLLSEKRFLADPRHDDLWMSLMATFSLFESSGLGEKLGIASLAGDLFGREAIGQLADCTLGNDVLLGCLRSLSLYEHPDNRQLIRVNYGALNVEEFGSVYEGLLEYQPVFTSDGGSAGFGFTHGDERAATGSHYTPDELVQPLIKHSLDYLITDRLKEPRAEQALLSLRVADISCGSGHILLAAARRIATELAKLRTGEDQPSPTAYRAALRDVIRECIYGVDLNPLAVELCKVALWLEAHNPGQPLNFLDHHIKCGNSIVGYLSREELDKGVPDEAFKAMPGDDKEFGAALRKLNKNERENKDQIVMDFSPEVRKHLDAVLAQWHTLSSMPERVPAEIEEKKSRFAAFSAGQDTWILNQIAAIPIAQFYIPKTVKNAKKIITNAKYLPYVRDGLTPVGQATAEAWATARQKRFFHWFLEFPETMAGGGFDCILGNPPYLGGKKISGIYGHVFCEYAKWAYAPTGISDLVTFFLKRIYGLLKPTGFMALITTNSVIDSDIRRDGLMQLLESGGRINMAVRGVKWSGTANLVVSEFSISKSHYHHFCVLDGKVVEMINAFFEDGSQTADPLSISDNMRRVFQGSIFLGEGFLISSEEAKSLIVHDPINCQVIFPTYNGSDMNSSPDQSPQRSIINFFDWGIQRAHQYYDCFHILEQRVKPQRDIVVAKGKQIHEYDFWKYWDKRPYLYSSISSLVHCFVVALVTKYLNFSRVTTDSIFSHKLCVFSTDRWDLYSVVQSTLHDVWVRKYSSSLGQTLNYSPSDCFITYAFPRGLWQKPNPTLAAIGKNYHQHRKALMLSLWLGLTDLYNLFHICELTPEMVAKARQTRPADAGEGHRLAKKLRELRRMNATEGSDQPPCEPDEELDQVELFTDTQQCYEALLELRHLHVQMDLAVRDAYGWQDLNLEHGFYEVDTLAENDRVRYTISPAARKELLRRLLELNLQRAAEEAEAKAAATPAKPKRGKKASADGGLFE